MRLLALLLTALFCAAQVPMPYDGTRLMPRLSWLGNHAAIPGHGLVGLWDLTGWDAATQSIPNFAPGQTAALQRGSTAGADTNDPTPSQVGLVFDGVNDFCAGDTITPAPKTVMLVFRPDAEITATSSAQFLLATYISGAGDLVIGLGNVTSLLTNEVLTVGLLGELYRTGWTTVGATISAEYHVVVAVDTGSAWEIYLDGENLPLTAVNPYSSARGNFIPYVGASSTATNPFAGVITAPLIWNRRLSVAEIEAASRWLKYYFYPTKGITLP
jgi:hypothetical protein